MPTAAHARLKLREIPKTVTLTGEQYIDLLAHLEAFDEVFASLAGYAPSPAGRALIDEALRKFDEGVLGPVGERDEQYERDPVKVEARARGAEYAAAILEGMADAHDLGLEQVLPEYYAPRATRSVLTRETRRLVHMAAGIREQGRLA